MRNEKEEKDKERERERGSVVAVVDDVSGDGEDDDRS